jgi:glycosyltransferase involved in cell wall biosynthesis
MPLNLTLLIQRTDIENKPGGDLIQFSQIKKYLEKRDYNIELIPWNPRLDLRDCDVVNLVNDRPLILADSLRLIKKMNPRPQIVISPIHHSDREVINLRKYGFTQSLTEVVFAKLLRIRLLEYRLLHVINILADLRMISDSHGSWVAIRTYFVNFSKVYSKRKLGSLLVSNNALQFLAHGEEQSFIKDYRIGSGKLSSRHVIPNGKPNLTVIHKSKIQKSDSSIVVIGRIEPRKRSLELAMLAHEMTIAVTFVGALASDGSQYAEKFLNIIEKSSYVDYLGTRSHSETFDIITRSNVLLNGSFAEVLSLVEIEAAAQGKWIVSSGAGYSDEYVPPNQLRIYPENDLIKGLELASQLAISQPIRFNAADIPSWDEIADRYSAMYQEMTLEKI